MSGTRDRGKASKRSGKKEKSTRKKMTVDEFFAKELPPLSDMITFCNNIPMSLYANSTGVKSPEVVFRGMAFSQNRYLSEEYLLNFRHSDTDLGVIIGTNNFRLPMVVCSQATRDLEEDEDEEAKLISLPDYLPVRAPLGSVIRSRRSVRSYSGKPITLAELSTILYYGDGVSGQMPLHHLPETESLGKLEELDLRTAESGGALYPVDLFALALNVEGLPRGAYRYLPRYHALKPVEPFAAPFEVEKLAQFGEIEVGKASLLLGYVYKLYENTRKYGEPGLGFAFIETGAIATNIHLVCTALGLGPCDIGGFSKPLCERLFDADGVTRHMINLTVVGR